MAITLDIAVPARRGSSFATPACGTVRIREGRNEVRLIEVPAAVARRLAGEDGQSCFSGLEEAYAYLRHSFEVAADERVVRMQATRDHASLELRDRLRREGFPDRVVDGALARAKAARVVSDARFAESFITSKLRAGWGIARIERELAARGVEASDVYGWPYEFVDPDDELERALEVAGNKRVGGKDAYAKLVRFLCGRGFALDVAKRAAHATLEDA